MIIFYRGEAGTRRGDTGEQKQARVRGAASAEAEATFQGAPGVATAARAVDTPELAEAPALHEKAQRADRQTRRRRHHEHQHHDSHDRRRKAKSSPGLPIVASDRDGWMNYFYLR